MGGLERIVLELIRAGTTRAQKCSVICVERPGDLADQARKLGATVISADKRAGLRPRLIGRMATILRELRPSVVHSHQLGALVYGGPAARKAGVSLIVHTEHGKHYAHSLRARWLGRFATRYAKRVFAVSTDIFQEIVRSGVAPEPKIRLALNGIDTQRFASADGLRVRVELGVKADGFLIGTVGRLAEVKQQETLLRAFALLIAQVPTAKLVLVGDGPMRKYLESVTSKLGITERVTFAGAQLRPENYIAAMDVFALTSRSEGTPLSILEAWAAGKPVIASSVGGIPDLIREGKTGLMFSPGNYNELKDRLADLAADSNYRQKLGEAARARVMSEFDVKIMADWYEQQYLELLRPDSKNGRSQP